MEQSLLQYLSLRENPSIHYMYLIGYEGRTESDPEVVAVKQAVSTSPIIEKMLNPCLTVGTFVSAINWGIANSKTQNDFVTVRALGILKKAGGS